MARFITTIGIRPELMKKYEAIIDDCGNFSEWVCNRIEAAYAGDEALLMQIDALKRQREGARAEMSRLYRHNAAIRKIINKDKTLRHLHDMATSELIE